MQQVPIEVVMNFHFIFILFLRDVGYEKQGETWIENR